MGRADSRLHGRMVFNVGARRSGTFWLQRLVTAHPAVAAVPSETYLFALGIAPLMERFHHGALGSGEVAKVYVERDAILDAVRDLCDAVFAPMLTPGSELLAERTPQHAEHLDVIGEVYPDARVVHIIRDGRDVVRSLLAQDWAPADVRAAAAEWRTGVERARRTAPAGRYREVRYEDLHAAPAEHLKALYEWLGLPAGPDVMELALREASIEKNLDPRGTPAGPGKWRDELGRDQVRAFDEVAGDLLDDLGYERDGGTALLTKAKRLVRRDRVIDRFAGDAELEAARKVGARHVAQVIFGRVLERLHTDPDGVAALLEPGARVMIEGREIRESALAGVLRDDPAFAGRQVRGEVIAAESLMTALLAYETTAGETLGRTLVVRSERAAVTEFVLERT